MGRFEWTQLTLPIVGAPMAGGPTTPELVAAVSDAGGLGMLAGGYLTAEALAARIARTRVLTSRPFGVNLFLPQRHAVPVAAVDDYRRALQRDWYAPRGLTVPDEVPTDGSDCFDAKVDLLLADPVPVVSFVFGLPDAGVLEAFRDVGTHTVVSAASPAEVRAALTTTADSLCVQGADAGGHRFTHTVEAEPDDSSALDLVREAVRLGSAGDVAVVAAGGVGTRDDARRLLDAGAVAVQVGTALLLADEAGTRPTHRRMLGRGADDPDGAATVVTRAFTGRPARGIANPFTDAMTPVAPGAYPELHHLTAPLRARAAEHDDPTVLNLWAGTAHHLATTGSAAEILARLDPR